MRFGPETSLLDFSGFRPVSTSPLKRDSDYGDALLGGGAEEGGVRSVRADSIP